MKKQMVLGMLLSLAITPMSFAAGTRSAKEVQSRMSDVEKKSQEKNAITVLNGVKTAEILDASANNLSKISRGADTSELKSALGRKFQIADEKTGSKTYDLMDISRVLLKADQETKEINKNELSADGQKQLALVEVAIQKSAEFLALANRTSDMKVGLSEQTNLEVQAFNKQLSLIPEILAMDATDMQAHIDIMSKAIAARTSPHINGDQAFAAALKEGRSKEEYLAKLEEILKCLRLKSI